MAILLNIILRASILKIMHGLWKKKQRVTYYDFSEFVTHLRQIQTKTPIGQAPYV
jgi:hypothetical protein